ncbi:CotH kinase family protein [Anaeromyxobacter terrae]|uniref:CotH kinase family protein n=1 Tax=Anaeromyxobacter terrae TaxID=2925406 RepID=UPI001F586BE7|nr:CotH kinase family protein [Anaeromyxobacter sp. SG22]
MKRQAPLLVAFVLALGCTGAVEKPGPTPPPEEPPPYQELPPSGPSWPAAGAPGELPSPELRIRRLDVTLAAEDLALLEANPYWDVMYPATVKLDGRMAMGLVRYRGASARTRPQKSWRIDLDGGYALEGRDRFALLAEYDDAAKLVERLAVDLYRALGLPVPYARFVKLYVNGVYRGVFLDMERVGGEYLVHHGHEPDASIYRCGDRNCEMKQLPRAELSYQNDFTKTRNETVPWDDLDRFLEVISRTDDADLERRLGEVMDLDAYLGNLAANELIANTVLEDARAYWVHELHGDLWTYVPWDLNNAQPYWSRDLPASSPLGGVWREPQIFSIYDDAVRRIYDVRVNERVGQRPTWSVLATRIWDHPALRARLLAKLDSALQGVFTPERVGPYLEALWAVVGPEIVQDPFVDATCAETEPARLVRFVHDRREILLQRLPALRAHGSGPLVVNEIGIPGDAEAGYVELYNRGSTDLDLSGAQVTDDLRVPAKYALPAGTVLPAHGHLVLVADGTPWAPPGPAAEPPHLPFVLSTSGGELGVFPPAAVHAPYDLVYFGPRASGSAYGRTSDGTETFGDVARTPGTAN